MLIDLVNPWHRGSHRSWAEGYAERSRHAIRLVALEGEAWRWRLQSGAVALVEPMAAAWRADGAPDVLLVSGMVDTSVLLGLLRPPERTKVVVYQHESQVARPRPDQPEARDAVLAQWRGWLAADEIWFATEWHRAVAFRGLLAFAESQPGPEITRTLRALADRTAVVPVGVDLEPFSEPAVPDGGPPIVLWNHRWEPDKDPAAFVSAVDRLVRDGVGFRLVLAGDHGDSGAPEYDDLLRRHTDRVEAAGPFDPPTYNELVRRADVVVSTAVHEFFGVAMVEAMAAGAVPVLPDRLAYPEILGEWAELAYADRTFGSALAAALDDLDAARRRTSGLAESMQRFDWSVVAADMDARLAGVR